MLAYRANCINSKFHSRICLALQLDFMLTSHYHYPKKHDTRRCQKSYYVHDAWYFSVIEYSP